MMVQFMSDKSGLKTRSLGLKTLGLQPCHSMSLSAGCFGMMTWAKNEGLNLLPQDLYAFHCAMPAHRSSFNRKFFLI